MKLLSFFQKRQPVLEQKVSRAYAIHMDGSTNSATWTKREYLNFVREAYRINVVAYQAVNKIATAISTIEWEAWADDKQILRHPILDLLRRPNPGQSGADWWKARIIYLLLSGNSYDERVLVGASVKELWPLRPDRMNVALGTSGMPSAYIYKVGSRAIRFEANEITGDSDILHTTMFNPADAVLGQSPVEAAAFAVDQHNAAMNWIQALLQNSARPSGALVVGKDTSLSDEEFARLKTEIESRYSGPANAGRPMLLEGGLDWKQMGLSPVDMEILRIKDSAARDISLAFGVPPLLLNIPGDNTYANYREARLGFYEDTILPFVGFLAAELSEWLGPYFGGIELRPNKDKIEAIADKRTKLWEMADNSFDLTLNEARQLKGYDPLPPPLGNTLMAEIKRPAPSQPAPPTDANAVKGFVYGPR